MIRLLLMSCLDCMWKNIVFWRFLPSVRVGFKVCYEPLLPCIKKKRMQSHHFQTAPLYVAQKDVSFLIHSDTCSSTASVVNLEVKERDEKWSRIAWCNHIHISKACQLLFATWFHCSSVWMLIKPRKLTCNFSKGSVLLMLCSLENLAVPLQVGFWTTYEGLILGKTPVAFWNDCSHECLKSWVTRHGYFTKVPEAFSWFLIHLF